MASRDDLAAEVTGPSSYPDFSGQGIHTSADSLAQEVGDIASPTSDTGKMSSVDAAYTKRGPQPFTCGNCYYFQVTDTGNLCRLVVGPEPGGQVRPEDSCRLWMVKDSIPANPSKETSDDGATARG